MQFDLASYLCPNPSSSPYTLDSGELCYSFLDGNGYTRFIKNQHYETLWQSDQFIWRGADSSEMPNGFYALFTGERYGSAWARRFMSVGDVFKRFTDVRHYDAQGKLLRTDYGVTTYLKLAQHYTQLTLAETQQTLGDVLLFEQSFDAAVANVYENYFFAKGLGLVAFDFTGQPPFHSKFSGFTQVKPVFIPLPGFDEPIPPPVEKAPIPVPAPLTPLGHYTLMQLPGDYINVREQPSTSGRDLGDLHKGDVVTLYTPDVNGWVHLTAPALEGWVSKQNGAVTFTPVDAPPPMPVWMVTLDVPYVSQLNTLAALSNNDCGIAALLMLERYWFEQHGLSTPTIPDVDDLTRRSPLAQPNPPHGLTFADLQQLALLTGFQTAYVQPMTAARMADCLDHGVPVLALVDYRTYNPKSATTFAHFMIVKGYNAEAFLTADPYIGGNNFVVPRDHLDAALKSVPGNVGSYQALALA